MPSKYETDYYAWAMETASALRAGRIEDVDIAAAAEEVEDLGKSERAVCRAPWFTYSCTC